MSGKKGGVNRLAGMLLISLLPAVTLGEHPQVTLEVRYCECDASGVDGSQAAVSPDFIEASTLLSADVSDAGSGHVSAEDISLEFEVRELEGTPGTYRFSYTGTYRSGAGENTSASELVLTGDEWYQLIQTRHDSGSESQAFGLAVRLVDSVES